MFLSSENPNRTSVDAKLVMAPAVVLIQNQEQELLRAATSALEKQQMVVLKIREVRRPGGLALELTEIEMVQEP